MNTTPPPASSLLNRDPEAWLTYQMVMTELHVSRKTLWRWIKSDGLAAHRIGGIVRIRRSDLVAFLGSKRVPPPAK